MTRFFKPFDPVRGTPNVDPVMDFQEEIDFLKRLRHPGVVRVLKNGRCTITLEGGIQHKTAYHICEFEENTVGLDKVIEHPFGDDGHRYGVRFLSTLMVRILAALQYCHDKEILHLDLHPGNILVRPELANGTWECGQAVLIDFGKAKHINPGRLGLRLPPYDTVGAGVYCFKHPHLVEHLRSNRVKREVFATPDSHRFDLFAIAECFHRVWTGCDPEGQRSTMGRLISNVIEELRNKGDKVQYSIPSALDALSRTSDVNATRKRFLLRLAGETNASIDEVFRGVIDSREFQRLRRTNQLAFTHLVYPSATHSRFSHSLGVLHMCSLYLESLYRNSPDFTFAYSRDDLLVAQLAALIHDLGHYPFAHYFEELGNLESFSVNFDHHHFTNRMLQGELKLPDSILSASLKRALGAEYYDAIQRIQNAPGIHDVLNGPIDCDKVDYLIRDGLSCGVPYASSIDRQRLLASRVTLAV